MIVYMNYFAYEMFEKALREELSKMIKENETS